MPQVDGEVPGLRAQRRVAGPTDRDQERDVRGPRGGQRQDPAAFAEPPQPDLRGVDAGTGPEGPYAGERVGGQEREVAVHLRVAGGPLVVDESGDPGAGERLGLL